MFLNIFVGPPHGVVLDDGGVHVQPHEVEQFITAHVREQFLGSGAIAGSAFFPALVLGVFWKRANREGAIAGM
ncbi:MAG: hypothetical protein JNG86_08690, partial [Verrucomicrobiaceae bacterium]|nr:hypothetical protein [Verrucomicrobiaceae bacterium]